MRDMPRTTLVIALLVGAGQACTSWRARPPTPDAFLASDSLVVRVTLTDSTQLDLEGAHIAQDSLRGMDTQSQLPVTVPLSDVELIQTRHLDAAKTVTLVLGVGLATLIVFFIALAQSLEGL